MSRYILIRASLTFASICSAAAADQPSSVPDPYGLGERLALIDFLREHQVDIPESDTVVHLRVLYADYLGQGDHLAIELRDERIQALRRTLIDRYHVKPPTHATLDDLIALQKENEERVIQETNDAMARDGAKEKARQATSDATASGSPDPAKARHKRQTTTAGTGATPVSGEPDFHGDGYTLYGLEKFCHLYMKVTEGPKDTVHVALWNGSDQPRGVKVLVTYSSGHDDQIIERDVGSHRRVDVLLSFPHIDGGRVEGRLMQVTP